jgi:predicted DNA-binding transcriptional regulator AlpA
MPEDDDFIRLSDFARRIGVHISTIYRNRSSYPVIDKLGGIAVIWRSDYELWKKNRGGVPTA